MEGYTATERVSAAGKIISLRVSHEKSPVVGFGLGKIVGRSLDRFREWTGILVISNSRRGWLCLMAGRTRALRSMHRCHGPISRCLLAKKEGVKRLDLLITPRWR